MLDFRPDGALAQRWHRNPDGSEWASTYHYNGRGQLTAVRSGDNLTEYEYDNQNRLARVAVRSENGIQRVSESYEYDGKGRKTKTLHIDPASQRPDVNYLWSVHGTDSHYSAPGAATMATHYNEREQPTHLVFQDAGGRLLNRVDFSYDEAGRLVEEAQTRTAESFGSELAAKMNPAQLETFRNLFSESFRRQHRYDDRGRRIETRTGTGPLGSDRTTVAYNDHGDPIQEIREHQSRDYRLDDEGRLSEQPAKEVSNRSETRLSYDCDARGNWVSKVVEGRTEPAQDFIVSSTELRTLTYFDEP